MENIENEFWKKIEIGSGDYFCSNLGRVKSFKKYGTFSRILKQSKTKKGYLQLGLSNNGVFKVHRIIAQTFIPNPDNKPQVNHINGIKTDNRLENLEWCDGKENMIHAFSINLISRVGIKNSKTKLSELQVLEIRKIGKTKKLKEIAEIYNIKTAAVHKILNRLTWKHI